MTRAQGLMVLWVGIQLTYLTLLVVVIVLLLRILRYVRPRPVRANRRRDDPVDGVGVVISS